VELALSGARAEAAADGARLRLDGSGRTLAYSRLRVEDVTGRELTARLKVLSPDRLAVSVADANATYPVRIDPTFSDADWVSLNGLPGANNLVMAIVTDGSGNVYVGGYFTVVGTVAANHIAKWDGRAWSALGSGMNANVFALAVSGTNLFAGGWFTTAGGVPANYIAKWDGSAWSALGSGIGGYQPSVDALAVSGNDLYAGGSFSTAGGVPAGGIAKWDGSTWLALGSGMDGSVNVLAAIGTNLYAGGAFTLAGGVVAPRFAKWDGRAWSALGSGMNGGWTTYYTACVYALAVSGTNLYAGGAFETAGGVSATNIARWNGSAWSALGLGANSYVKALGVSGADLYTGGEFTTAGGLAADYIAKWDGRAWSALGSGMNGDVRALAVSGTNLYAGGYLHTAGGVTANCVAKWDGGVWSALGSGMNGGVFALAVSGTSLYAGGSFTTAGGVSATNIAEWNGSTWSALGSGINGEVRALAVSGNVLYAGGQFTTAGGVPANFIAQWSGAWWRVGSGMNGSVDALAVVGTNLYAGGSFTSAGGMSANCIAKWDGSAWTALASGFHQSPPGWIHALAVSGTDLYARGDWTVFSYSGVEYVAGNVAKWNGSAWWSLGRVSRDGDSNPSVYALLVTGANLYAGGHFTTAGGMPANYIAKWDGSAWSALGSGMDSTVYALAADDARHLFVGGGFSLAGTNASPYIAQANLGSAPTILTSPPTQTAEAGSIVHLAVNATGDPPPAYQWYLNGTNILSCTSCDLVLTNLLFSQSGTYTVVLTNIFGAVTNAPVMLNVIAPVARRLVPGVKLIAPVGTFWGLDYRDNFGPTANWETLAVMSLTNASQFYFDLSAPLPPQWFYRAWQSGTPSVMPSLDLHLVPAITLMGNIGHSVRVDYINQFGPTDAWVTLDTVTLTNTSQPYFDTSSIGQPARLYRVVQMP
jgi:hypothetical protein